MSSDIVKALIYTDKFKVEGSIHLLFKDSYRGRLSDHLNSDRAPTFLPVTDAKVYKFDGKEPIFEPACILLNTKQIEAIIELSET